MTQKIVLRVAAKAVIVDNGRVLILREATTNPDGTNPGKYHVPGGRLEPGENFFDGLKREVAEETGLEVTPRYPVHVDEWRPVIHDTQQQIIAMFVVCDIKSGKVRLSEEHDEFSWINPERHADYDLLPGERAAIAAYLERCI